MLKRKGIWLSVCCVLTVAAVALLTLSSLPRFSASRQPTVTVVNLNSADRDTLLLLPGMTGELAEGVLSYRTRYGAFVREEELTRVEGVTIDDYEEWLPFVTVGEESVG